MSQETTTIQTTPKKKTFSKFIARHVKIIPSITTLILFIIAYIIGGILFSDIGFVTFRTFFSLFTDSPFLFISAVGMTLVIISGGIDLSVGSVAALSTMIIAYGTAIEHGPDLVGMGWPIGISIFLALAVGTLLGFAMGVLIQVFKVEPFIATLAGMFFARGMTFVISIDSIPIRDEWFTALGRWRIQFRDVLSTNPNSMVNITIGVFIFLALLVFVAILMRSTKLGRNIYALGGNEQSAQLMGLPVRSTRIFVYTFNGFCSALAGLVFALSLGSGFGRHLIGMELDVIAAVVIGGTLLTGGMGYPLGSMFGVMTTGLIGKFVTFGNMLSGYARIATAALLFLFIVLQRIIIIIADKNKEA
ncbi:MAG: sugar ABC transporter permease YjfF [Oscillospiraceae bacterium]|nr:sugar ABC transporter permease YjfF [Oscillospiraceae bacterium]